jgi:adenosylmethionine-8-amino-7-oxononanoate aminotransferase
MRHLDRVPPLAIARGNGVWLTDVDEHRYFDATSSWWVNLFGHANGSIGNALKEQLDTLEHVMLAGCTHAPAVELAERLSALTGGVLGHAFFASDGASAVEIALKMSFHYWRNQGRTEKKRFICLRHGYHGETIGALSVTDVAIFRDVYDPLLRQAYIAISPDARQALPGETAADVSQRAIADLSALLTQRSETIAAIIVEPMIQCAGGMAMYDAGYLHAVRALCTEFDVHLIADEIAVGCGRTGKFFASEHAMNSGEPHEWPDFICLSKGITGGYLPLSLVLTRDDVYEAFYDEDIRRGFLHSHSYTGNPLACRAALATLALFEREDVLRRNTSRAQWLTDGLARVCADPRVRHARQLGMIWACDVADDKVGETFAERFHLAARQQELLMRPLGNVLYVMPPYIIDEADAHWLGERVHKALDMALNTSEHAHAA